MTAAKDLPARPLGTGESVGTYVVGDDQMAVGSTLGSPRLCMTIKASEAIEKIYSVDAGEVLFDTLVLHFWDGVTGAKLLPLPGHSVMHPRASRASIRVCRTTYRCTKHRSR